jgi:hypothetical protein
MGASPSYYWQWGEGQAKVAVLFLLTLSFYFGNKGKPVLSGIIFALGFFDPRFGLLAAPLFLLYNRAHLKTAILSGAVALCVSNLMLLYPPMGTGIFNHGFFPRSTNTRLLLCVHSYAHFTGADAC